MHGGSGLGGSLRRGQFDIDEDQTKIYDSKVILRLLSYVMRRRGTALLTLSFMLIYTAVTILIPLVLRESINRYVQNGDTQGLNTAVAIFFALVLVNYISNSSHLWLLAKMGQDVLYDLRSEIFTHLQKLSMSFHSKYKVGSLMSRAQNDVQQLQEFFNIISTSIGDLLALTGIVVIMFLLSWKLALITMAALPILIAIVFYWQRYARPIFLRVRFAISSVNGSLQENISGVRVVQSLNRQESNLKEFDSLNSSHLEANIRATKVSASLMPTVEFFTGIALASLVVYGGQMVSNQALDAGLFLAFVLWVQRFFDPIRILTMQLTQLQRAMASGLRIFELLDTEPEISDSGDSIHLPEIKGHIKFDSVCFSYTKNNQVLYDVNLEILPGQTVALVGPTGAGKTTIAALLSRFYDVSSGTISIDGVDIRDARLESLSTQMGIVLQEPFLFTGSIEDNIKYKNSGLTSTEVKKIAAIIGLDGYIEKMPNGYQTVLEERGGNLSLGQRQLLSFARALASNPRILILDEATANVDTQTEQRIQGALKQLLQNRTSVIIAHRLSTIRSADKIVFMNEGRIIETGSHDELIHKKGIYAEHYKLNQGLVEIP